MVEGYLPYGDAPLSRELLLETTETLLPTTLRLAAPVSDTRRFVAFPCLSRTNAEAVKPRR